ncbi:glutathione S-transferase [Polyporus arcularius HHB13444]|uniref:Glutathione S-transferase n=1 Tax=Polyporus arcularius HHB13444 TaxID=1314778 RepID=A0A5C3Q815_9APHY|nr:glutathione S-transferase [Polyporus arcularius HHB13444]
MIVLEELGLDYETVYLNLSTNEIKDEKYTKYNPNGRIPTLVDHKNNDFVVWELGAIISYVTEKYGPTRTISFEKFEDKMHMLQWLFFQASGQGPYYGQASWFMLFASEKIPSAIVRYQKEIIRILGVLESVLSKQRWLVGEKFSAADVSFITWNHAAFRALVKDFEGFNLEKDFPSVNRWHNEMLSRPAVGKVFVKWQAW